MTDKVQLIKEEIERRLMFFSNECDETRMLSELLQFIDSLPEESASEVLEEEILCRWEDDPHTLWPKCPYSDFKNIARHFAEWQKQRDQETIELAEDHAMLAGMNKMKEEMMKDAVDAFVHQGLYSKYVTECDDEALANALKNYNSGDKVKIIIVKEN